MNQKTELVIFKVQDGNIKLDANIENETVWLSQNQISELFERDRSIITQHIKSIFKGKELDKKATCIFCTLQIQINLYLFIA